MTLLLFDCIQAQLEQFKLTFRWWVVPAQQGGPDGDRLVISLKANHGCVDHYPDMAVNAVLHEAAFRFWVNGDLPTEVRTQWTSVATGAHFFGTLATARGCDGPFWPIATARHLAYVDAATNALPAVCRRGDMQSKDEQGWAVLRLYVCACCLLDRTRSAAS